MADCKLQANEWLTVEMLLAVGSGSLVNMIINCPEIDNEWNNDD